MRYCTYTITCKTNNKIYVGYTSDFFNRKRKHLDFLRRGKHVNPYLQSAYNKYGEENFTIEVLTYCSKETAYSEEHYWCNLLNTHNRDFGYNLAPTDPNKRNSTQSAETKMKRIKTMTGRTLAESHVESLRLARIGCKNSEESKEKVKNWFKENGHPSKGVKRSQEVRDKMSLLSRGKPKLKRRKRLISIENQINVEIFDSVRDFTDYYKICHQTLSKKVGTSNSISTKLGINITVCYEK